MMKQIPYGLTDFARIQKDEKYAALERRLQNIEQSLQK